MDLSRPEVAARLRSTFPDDVAERLIASLRSSARIFPEVAQHALERGQSRFGGWPDLPPGFEWPTCVGLSNPVWQAGYRAAERRKKGIPCDVQMVRVWQEAIKPMYAEPKPLTLLAQLNLAELPRGWELELPDRGQLLVFCDMGDELVFGGPAEPLDRWRVFWLDVTPDQLTTVSRPGGDAGQPPVVCVLRFEQEWTVARNRYDDLSEEEGERLNEALQRQAGAPYHHAHRLSGHPDAHGCAGCEAELTLRQPPYDVQIHRDEQEAVEKDWRQLLQFDYDEELGWWWGDTSRMHFMIRRSDLKQLEFGRVMPACIQ